MSKTSNKPIDNAQDIIERFGGIRPMASKTGVAVTTIQGWKKRGTIPANRRKDVLKAARDHNIALPELGAEQSPASKPATSSANQNEQAGTGTQKIKPAATHTSAKTSDEIYKNALKDEDMMKKLSELEDKIETDRKNDLVKMTIMMTTVIVLAVALYVSLFRMDSPPQTDPQSQKVEALQAELAAVREELQTVQQEQNFLGGLIPDNLDEQISELQSQATAAQEQARVLLEQAKAMSSDALAGGPVQERLARIEARLEAMGINATPMMAQLTERFSDLRSTDIGQGLLDQTVSELNALLSGIAPSEPVDQALQTASEQSTTIGTTFENVPGQDLKAAALLLGLTQFRSSLNRNKDSFAEDLALLQKLIGEDNPELQQAISRLSPHAESGVLTSEGLSTEFRTLAGEAVVASLKGEDVSLQERAQARMNELFQIEKDGELITGTPTQATVQEAEAKLQQGDIQGAISAIETLEGPAASILQPWLQDARATLDAQQVERLLRQTIRSVTGGGRPIRGITASGNVGNTPALSEPIKPFGDFKALEQ